MRRLRLRARHRLADGPLKRLDSRRRRRLPLVVDGDPVARVVERDQIPVELLDVLPLVDLGMGQMAAQVDAGGTRTCARLDDGAVKCWGSNAYGSLGLGENETARGDEAGEMGDSFIRGFDLLFQRASI